MAESIVLPGELFFPPRAAADEQTVDMDSLIARVASITSADSIYPLIERALEALRTAARATEHREVMMRRALDRLRYEMVIARSGDEQRNLLRDVVFAFIEAVHHTLKQLWPPMLQLQLQQPMQQGQQLQPPPLAQQPPPLLLQPPLHPPVHNQQNDRDPAMDCVPPPHPLPPPPSPHPSSSHVSTAVVAAAAAAAAAGQQTLRAVVDAAAGGGEGGGGDAIQKPKPKSSSMKRVEVKKEILEAVDEEQDKGAPAKMSEGVAAGVAVDVAAAVAAAAADRAKDEERIEARMAERMRRAVKQGLHAHAHARISRASQTMGRHSEGLQRLLQLHPPQPPKLHEKVIDISSDDEDEAAAAGSEIVDEGAAAEPPRRAATTTRKRGRADTPGPPGAKRSSSADAPAASAPSRIAPASSRMPLPTPATQLFVCCSICSATLSICSCGRHMREKHGTTLTQAKLTLRCECGFGRASAKAIDKHYFKCGKNAYSMVRQHEAEGDDEDESESDEEEEE